MIEAIWQWHLDAGGNFQGFMVGLFALITMGGIVIFYLMPPRKNEISDEDFFSIVADDPTTEDIYEAMDKDDNYS